MKHGTMHDGSYEEQQTSQEAENTRTSLHSLAESALAAHPRPVAGHIPAAVFPPVAHLRQAAGHVLRPVRCPGLDMQMRPGDRDDPEVRKPALQNNLQNSKQDSNSSGQQEVIRQTFPPTTISGFEIKTLLQTWGRLVSESEKKWRLRKEQWRLQRTQVTEKRKGVRGLALPHAFLIDCMLSLIRKMEDDITSLQDLDVAMLRQDGTLQAVGLLSKDPLTGDASVKALAVFSREQLELSGKGTPTSYTERTHPTERPASNTLTRDQNYSLQEVIESQFGIEASKILFSSGEKNSVSVFALEGLIEPELSARAVKVLLAKIAKWAKMEQRLVTVATHAVRLGDGTDLTAYYARLGFIEVKMDDGSSILVYARSSTSDTDRWLVDRQFMVRLDPWKLVL